MCITFIVRVRFFRIQTTSFLFPLIVCNNCIKKNSDHGGYLWSSKCKKLIRFTTKLPLSLIISVFVIINYCSWKQLCIPPKMFFYPLFLLTIFVSAFKLRRAVSARHFRARRFLPPWEPITLPPSYENGRPSGRWSPVYESPIRACAYVRESLYARVQCSVTT